MRRIVTGNLLDSDVEALVNTVNTQGVTAAAHAWSERKRRVLTPENLSVALDRLADRGWAAAVPPHATASR